MHQTNKYLVTDTFMYPVTPQGRHRSCMYLKIYFSYQACTYIYILLTPPQQLNYVRLLVGMICFTSRGEEGSENVLVLLLMRRLNELSHHQTRAAGSAAPRRGRLEAAPIVVCGCVCVRHGSKSSDHATNSSTPYNQSPRASKLVQLTHACVQKQ